MAVFAMTASPSLLVATTVSALSALGVSGGLGPLYAVPPVLFGAAGGATASGLAASAAMAGAVTSTYLGGWMVGEGEGYGTAFWVYAIAAAATALVLVPLVAARLQRAHVPA
jgi:hypothetical protein